MSENMSLLNRMHEEGFENVVACCDPSVALMGFIVLHDTTLGPGFGGTRIMEYGSEEEALRDAMRLAKAMTYKNAAAGIDFGGGKAVLIGDPVKVKTEAYLRSFGRHIDGLAGRYVTGVDVGTDSDDMVVILRETKHVVALPESYGGCGDTTAATAFGVYWGIKMAASLVLGSDDLDGRTVAIQGTGHIGSSLARSLATDGARLYLSDVDTKRVAALGKELGATVVPPNEISRISCDIFSPNALGSVLNDQTIPGLRCKVVAGAANNQLLEESRHSVMLADRGITFIPDFILNAGGVINNSFQFTGYNREKAYSEIRKHIPGNVERIIIESRSKGMTPQQAALQLADERLRSIRGLKKYYLEG